MAAKLSGSSGKKYGVQQNADINVTPFVDVMLVLLIIFMVAAPLATQSLRIDLPPPNNQQTTKKIPLVLVQIDDDNNIYVGIKDGPQAKSSIGALAGDVARTFSQNGLVGDDQKVTIRATEHVRYGNFMQVLNTLEVAGFSKIGLALEGA